MGEKTPSLSNLVEELRALRNVAQPGTADLAAVWHALPTLLSALEGEKETEHDVEKAALAFAMHDGCGAQVNGTRVLCDDDRVSPEARVLNCICRQGMRKALAALKSPSPPVKP